MIFNEGLVKVCENYLRKGSTVYIEGALQTRKFEQNGVEKYATEIVLKAYNGVLTMVGGKRDSDGDSGGGRSSGGDGYSGGGGQQQSSGGGRQSYDLNDDIPF